MNRRGAGVSFLVAALAGLCAGVYANDDAAAIFFSFVSAVLGAGYLVRAERDERRG